MTENLIICTCIQSFDSVGPHLESLESRNQVLLNILAFSCRIQFKFARSTFSPGYGYNVSKTSNLYLKFSIFRIRTLDPYHRRHELQIISKLLTVKLTIFSGLNNFWFQPDLGHFHRSSHVNHIMIRDST